MRSAPVFRALTGLVFTAVVSTPALLAQASPAHTHMGHVADGFRGTPDEGGLLPTAVAEATVAAQHASLAANDPANLDAMKRHAGHVLNALDPTVVESGPGAGYGVKAAATGAQRHIQLAAEAEGASDNVKTHSTHIATAAGNAVTWTDEAIEIAQNIQAATSAEAAAALIEDLVRVTTAIASGTDANGDGRVGWQEGEGGLAQAAQHMTLMKNGETGDR